MLSVDMFDSNRIHLLFLPALLLSTSSCATPPTPAAPTPPTAQQREQLYSFQLQDVAVSDALRAMSSAVGMTLVVSPEAQPIVRCARLTVMTPTPVPMSELVDLTERALLNASLHLEIQDTGWLIRKTEGATSADCASEARTEEPGPVAIVRDVTTETEILQGIREVGEGKYEVQSAVLDTLLENQAMLMRLARFVPTQKNGKVVGLQIFGIRPHGVMTALGFRNGDQLDRIAGLPITSPDNALDVYAKVRNASNLNVEITRRGTKMTLQYVFVPGGPDRTGATDPTPH